MSRAIVPDCSSFRTCCRLLEATSLLADLQGGGGVVLLRQGRHRQARTGMKRIGNAFPWMVGAIALFGLTNCGIYGGGGGGGGKS